MFHFILCTVCCVQCTNCVCKLYAPIYAFELIHLWTSCRSCFAKHCISIAAQIYRFDAVLMRFVGESPQFATETKSFITKFSKKIKWAFQFDLVNKMGVFDILHSGYIFRNSHCGWLWWHCYQFILWVIQIDKLFQVEGLFLEFSEKYNHSSNVEVGSIKKKLLQSA